MGNTLSNMNVAVDETTVVLLAVAVGLTILIGRRTPTPDLPLSRWASQTQVSSTRQKGETAVYRSRSAYNGLVKTAYPDVRTLYEAFQRGLSISKDDPCLGRRIGDGPFVWITYDETNTLIRQFGSGLVYLGIEPGQDTCVGIYSINRPEWIITEQACYFQSMVTVPLYDTLGPKAAQYVINKVSARVVVAGEAQMQQLFRLKPEADCLEILIKMSALTDDEREEAKRLNVRIYSMDEVYALGKEHPVEARPPQPHDLATICFTSGTTDNPKGVMLSHTNLVANSAAVTTSWPASVLPTKHDVHLSYLTLAHVLERLIHTFIYASGARVGFYRGEIPKLLDDVVELKPTYFISVPRLWNRIYDKVFQTIEQSSWIKRKLFYMALASKTAMLRKGIVRNNTIWDYVVFHTIRARLGGRVKGMVTGAAPIAPEVMDFLRVAFGCQVFEGYGQTEAAAAISATIYGDYNPGHVGPPLSCVEVKLVDVPEMGYHATDEPNPRGELCARGYSISSGYYKDPERTAETWDSDGWLHTGDIAEINPNGTIRIIDRKKNIFKLAHGEYVAPEKLEIIFEKSKLVGQAYVHGDSLRANLVAIIVPDEGGAAEWAKNAGHSANVRELCADADFKKAVLDDIARVGRENKCVGYEIPKAIHLEPEPFTMDNDMLTQSFKLRRFNARKRYDSVIQTLYAGISDKQR